uniref:Serum response factor homolog n=1 Tax=Parastrongyloides trichosuri TaxID=131310 RepID=A0A0N4ZSB1_PARTI
MTSSPIKEEAVFNLSNFGANGSLQSLFLSHQQTSTSDMASSSPSKESSPQCDTPNSTDPILNSLYMNSQDITSSMENASVANGGLLPNGKKTKGRVKIKMEYIGNKLRRYTTFSKRKTGIMKKAYELSTLTGTQVMLLVASETGHVYTFATSKLKPMISSDVGRNLIQTCLNTPDEKIDDNSSCKTEFTFEPPMGSVGSGSRKRKFHDTENISLQSMINPATLNITSVSQDDFESDNDSDSGDAPETSAAFLLEATQRDVAEREKQKNLQQTLKDALKAAANQREVQKKNKESSSGKNGKNDSGLQNGEQNSVANLFNPNMFGNNNNNTGNTSSEINAFVPFLLQNLLNSYTQNQNM